MNYVTFTASLVWFSDLSERQLLLIFQQLARSDLPLLIEGEVLRIKEYPTEITSPITLQNTGSESESEPTEKTMELMAWSMIGIIAAIIICILVLFSGLVVIVLWRKHYR